MIARSEGAARAEASAKMHFNIREEAARKLAASGRVRYPGGMGKRFSSGLVSLLTLASLSAAAACGGLVDDGASSGDAIPLPPRSEEAPAPAGTGAPRTGPEAVAEGLGTPSAIAMTADRVVFTTRTTTLGGQRVEAGALFVADKKVGPALMIAVDKQGASFDALATDGKDAWVATSDARLLATPVAGGETRAVATLPAAAVLLAVAGGHVYFATEAGAVGRVAEGGGEPESLGAVAGAVRGLEADDAAVYVATGARDYAPAGITRIPLDAPGDAKVIAGGEGGPAAGGEPCAMVRDGRRLFWSATAPASASSAAGASGAPTAGATGGVYRLALDAPAAISTVASGAFAACAIAVDDTSLWFATAASSALPVKSSGAATAGLGLMRAPVAGGEPTPVAGAAGALAQPGSIAVDGTHLYWLTSTSVLRLKK